MELEIDLSGKTDVHEYQIILIARLFTLINTPAFSTYQAFTGLKK